MFFFIIVWIEQFGLMCKKHQENNILDHTEKCLELFRTLQKGLGKTFFLFFCLFQMDNIFCMFLGISANFSDLHDVWMNTVCSICYFLMCLYFCTILYSITMTAEAAHSSLQALATPLHAELATVHDRAQRHRLKADLTVMFDEASPSETVITGKATAKDFSDSQYTILPIFLFFLFLSQFHFCSFGPKPDSIKASHSVCYVSLVPDEGE